MSQVIIDKIEAAERRLVQLRRALAGSQTIQWLQEGAKGVKIVIDSGPGPEEAERYLRRAFQELRPQIVAKATELAQDDIDSANQP